MRHPRWPVLLIGLAAMALAPDQAAWAGPPFLTDDPEPVEFEHWEIYAAAQWTRARAAASGTLPHIEVNYGALPGLQVHAIVPAVLAWNRGEPLHYGIGDVELGAKLRFLDEGAWRPQVGVFPEVTFPSGSSARGLGTGAVQALLPLWLQKSFGPWTTYGGGGVRLAREGDAVVAGWLLQRALSDKLELGVEAFVTVPFEGRPVQTQVNAGLVINLTTKHHVLLSAGPSFGADTVAQAYMAWQVTP